jgi:hypothetical protein
LWWAARWNTCLYKTMKLFHSLGRPAMTKSGSSPTTAIHSYIVYGNECGRAGGMGLSSKAEWGWYHLE